MKLRKVIFLPLALVALAGCELFAKPVAKEEANKQVAAAMQKSTTEKHESVEGSLGVKLEAKQIEYVDVVTSPNKTRNMVSELDISFKAKDINKESFQFAGTLDGKVEIKEDNVLTSLLSGNAGIYYDANWLYLDYKVTVKDGASAPTKTEENKGKLEVGPIVLPSVDDIDNPVAEIDLETMLNSVNKIKARKVGKDLVVTYEITQADLVDTFLQIQIDFANGMGVELTSAQIDEMRVQIEAELKTLIEIRKASLNVVVSEAGLITKFDAVLEVDVYGKLEAENGEDVQPQVEVNTKTTLKGSVKLAVKYNQPVTITLPDFSGYVEMQMSALL